MSACEFGCDGSGIIKQEVKDGRFPWLLIENDCPCVHTRPTLPMDAPPAECDETEELDECET